MRQGRLLSSVALATLVTLVGAACSGGGSGAASSTSAATTLPPTTTVVTTSTTAATTTTLATTTTTAPPLKLPPPILWVTHPREGLISRIDAATGQVLDTIDVGGLPQDILYAEGAVWVVDSTRDSVLRIDPISLEVVRLDAGPFPYRLTAIPGLILVTNSSPSGALRVLRAADGAVLASLAVGAYPTATAIVPGPPPDRSAADAAVPDVLWWYLWVAHSDDLLLWFPLDAAPAPVPAPLEPGLSTSADLTPFFGLYPLLEPDAAPPGEDWEVLSQKTDALVLAMEAARMIGILLGYFERTALELEGDAARLEGEAARARAALQQLLDAVRRGDAAAVEALKGQFPYVSDQSLALRWRDCRDTIRDLAQLQLAMRDALRRGAGTSQESEIRIEALKVSDQVDLTPYMQPPTDEPDGMIRRAEEAQERIAAAAATMRRALDLAAELTVAFDAGEELHPSKLAAAADLIATLPGVPDWPSGDPEPSTGQPQAGLEDLLSWAPGDFGTGWSIFGLSWDTGELLRIDPYSWEIEERWPGPEQLRDGFAGADGALFGVGRGEGLWRFDGQDFTEHLAIPGLSSAAAWWDAIYAATEGGEIEAVGYDGAAQALLAGLPPIDGIAVQPPDGLTPAGPEECPGVPSYAAVIPAARLPGYGRSCPDGTLAGALGLRDPSRQWEPLWNPIVWKCGCP